MKNMNDDLISRQEAIDALSTPHGVLYPIRTVEELPSAQPTGASCWGCNCPKMERLKEQKTFSEMVHLHDAETHDKCTETHSCDYQRTVTHDWVSRDAVIKAMLQLDNLIYTAPDFIDAVRSIPSAEPESRYEQRWIPFKTRPLTDEEKEEYPYYMEMLDCQLPENGQRILVNVKWNGHEFVQMDEYYNDDGSYLDSGYEIGSEATAWMPLPEPYKEGQE